ncbi:hypothetical protein BDZ89DRAFT_985002 [Hymenopellis radicata]|nr:hypothetical protein BDZ89DRAFT_985002 [Hymenopellis radicata]
MSHSRSFPMRPMDFPSLPPPLVVSESATSLPEQQDHGLPFFATPADKAQPSLWTRLTKGWRHIICHSWLNILLFLIPIAFVLNQTLEEPEIWVFSFSLLGLIPLIQLHEITTLQLTTRLGGATSGLINASMANFVEIIVASTALRKCELRVVQSTLIGSMLSRILLVLGICFFAGGIRFSEQVFEQTANAMNMSLLNISVGAILLPAVYHFALSDNETDIISASQKQSILQMSHSVSIVLMFIYFASLVFQLWSHNHLYQDNNYESREHSKDIFKAPMSKFMWKRKSIEREIPSPHFSPKDRGGFQEVPLKESYSFTMPGVGYNSSVLTTSRSDLSASAVGQSYTVRLVDGEGGIPMARGASSRNFSGSTYHGSPETVHDDGYKPKRLDDDYDQPTPHLPTKAVEKKAPEVSLFLVLLLLAVVTAGVGFTADWLVGSMNEVSTTISKEWVGLILLPAVGSLAECASAISTSYKDKLSFSISVAVGSTIQTALFVTPFMVTVAWIAGKPLALLFDPFESLVLYISVQVMNYTVSDGKSNWLEGLILICLYIIIGVSFWFYPGSTLSSSLAVCHPDVAVI